MQEVCYGESERRVGVVRGDGRGGGIGKERGVGGGKKGGVGGFGY
jgi:hypothetical protein